MLEIRGVDGEFVAVPESPVCGCDGTGMTTITVTVSDGRTRDIARVCRACRPDTASRLPVVADYAARAPVTDRPARRSRRTRRTPAPTGRARLVLVK